MKSGKKLFKLGFISLITLALAVTGCNSGKQAVNTGSETKAEAKTETKTQGSGEKTKLRVAWWGNTERDKLYYKINDMFMAENPDVEIITESPGWNDYWVAMATAYASGSAPDVVQFQSNQIGEYVSKGVLAPFEPYIQSGIINIDDWNPGFVDTGRYKDNLYMLTLGMTAQAMYANETLLNEIGMELWPADKNITWNEFEAYLNEVQSKLPDDTYAALDIYNNNDLVWVWMRQNGTEWVDASGKFAPTEETLEGWYDFSHRMRASGAFPNLEWNQEWYSKAWQEGPLVNRKVAFFFANANQYKLYQNNTEDNIAIRKVPVGNDGAHGDLLITSAYGISEKSQNKELAAKYINFFANNLEAQKVFNMELGVPGSLTVQKALAETADPSDVAATEYLNMISKDAPPFIAKAPGVWAIQNEINSVAEQVGVGAFSPKQAAEHIIKVANDIIEENAQ